MGFVCSGRPGKSGLLLRLTALMSLRIGEGTLVALNAKPGRWILSKLLLRGAPAAGFWMGNVRTIRKLDAEPGTRIVNGVEVRRDLPIPERADRFRAGELFDLLSALEVKEYFFHHSHGRAAARKVRGKKFTSLRQEDGRWLIMRVA